MDADVQQYAEELYANKLIFPGTKRKYSAISHGVIDHRSGEVKTVKVDAAMNANVVSTGYMLTATRVIN